MVAFTRASVFVFASSKVTRTCFFSNRTSTLETPGTFSSAFFTVIGHAGQVMPETFKVTVWGDAQAEATNASAPTTAASAVLRFFITTPPWSRFSKRALLRTDITAQRERALK